MKTEIIIKETDKLNVKILAKLFDDIHTDH